MSDALRPPCSPTWRRLPPSGPPPPPPPNQTTPTPPPAPPLQWHYAPLATRLAQAGVITAVMSYSLYPQALIPQMVAEVRGPPPVRASGQLWATRFRRKRQDGGRSGKPAACNSSMQAASGQRRHGSPAGTLALQHSWTSLWAGCCSVLHHCQPRQQGRSSSLPNARRSAAR